jgi:tetratricopeptide (TPR) repeat protein
MKPWSFLAAAILAAGCAATSPPAPNLDPLFNDAEFKPGSERIDPGDVFATSEAMRRFLRDHAADVRSKGPQKALFDALYSANQLQLEYDSGMTRNAAQAFADRAGNCLSLVIMTATLAKELGLHVKFQQVSTDESWSRAGDTYFASAHVNVTLARERRDPRVKSDQVQLMTIDFIPPKENEMPPRLWELSEATVIAMYFNNRAAETLAAGRIDDAYWWARAAIRQDPRYLSAYNTLGVVYKKKGDFARAERVLQEVLAREPRNLNAMTNLALVYNDSGREREAEALSDRIDAMQPTAPFHWFEIGTEAMKAGDYRKAKTMFQREVDRDPYYHEFHFWLAAACLRLGETDAARKHMALAVRYSPTRSDHDLYTAKLARIKASR